MFIHGRRNRPTLQSTLRMGAAVVTKYQAKIPKMMVEPEVQQKLQLLPTLELGVQRKMEPWVGLLPLELEVQQELELPPTLELEVQQKLEP